MDVADLANALTCSDRGTSDACSIGMRWTQAWLSSIALALFAPGCADPAPKMHIERSDVASGAEVVVVFDAPLEGKAKNQYWVALQRADEPVTSTAGRVVVERMAHSVRLRTSQPGELEVRLHGGYPRLDHHLLARMPVNAASWPVEVGTQLTSDDWRKKQP